MEYKNLDEIDLKLHLLSGSSINVGNLTIEPYTLSEIKDYGYKSFMKNLQWFSLTIDDFIDSTNDVKKKKILEQSKADLKAFDFYMKLGGSEFRDALLIILAMVFKTTDIKILNNKMIGIDFEKNGIYLEGKNGLELNQEKLDSLKDNEIKIVHRENFDEIVKVVNLQNYLLKPRDVVESTANPANDEVKALMEQMEKMRKKVEEKKSAQREQEGESNIDIADIISAVSSKSNSISKLNIWKLTLYQLYDEYTRLELIDNYDFSIQAMMTGAKKIDLKHWSSKI